MIEVNPNTVKSLYINVCFNETVIAYATGFLVNQNGKIYLITNRHVVTGKNNETGECLDSKMQAIPNNLQVWIPYSNNNGISWILQTIQLYDENENKLWLEHLIYKEKVDVVALLFIGTITNIITYNFETSYNPVITENVFIIGYPYGYLIRPKNGLFAIWSTGTIASEPSLDLNIGGIEAPAFLIDAKTRKGQSGSPVIYYSSNGMDRRENGFAICNGPVLHEIGIYSGRINAESDLGYVWKWSVIKDIIEQSQTDNC
jgi:S1-C subfamily serine protease